MDFVEDPPANDVVRIRQIPHIDGNFSTHIYIPVHLSRSVASKVLDRSNQLLFRLTGTTPLSFDSHHLSLSRHVFLKPHMISRFLVRSREVLSQKRKTILFLMERYKIYLNDLSNTCFIGIPVNVDISPTVLDLIKSIDSVLEEFDLPVYYENPSPHVSLACCSNERGFEIPADMTLEEPLPLSGEEIEELFIHVDNIRVCVGKETFTINLSS
jgi:hypothetical protein